MLLLYGFQMKRYCFKWLNIGLLVVLFGTARCHAQKEVVYRDYDRLGWAILDSLKRPGAASLFKGMSSLKRETRMLQESSPVVVKPRPAGKRKLKPEEIISQRRESVLMVFKYTRATTRRKLLSLGRRPSC